jgi:phosphate transport system permease protein
MSAETFPGAEKPLGSLPNTDQEIRKNVGQRRTIGNVWRWLFLSALLFGFLALSTLLYTIVNDSFGLVVYEYTVDPSTLSDRPLEELSQEELVTIFQENVSAGLYRRYDREQPFAERSQQNVLDLVNERVVESRIARAYTLSESLFNRQRIEQQVAEQYPNGDLQFRSWVSWDFLTTPMSSVPDYAGIRTALLGSIWMIAITMLIAFPVGVAGAVYLEEYADKSRLNRLIETNINNLAGVPSIIYGMLGLAIFVRALEQFTSGRFIGVQDSNGRTILSGALTMALLILPLIIINAREAIRAVPSSLRQASYGLGATKWQTVWHHVLPNALPGIMTGTILGMSRAIGETAPLIVVGASTFIVSDPSGPFSKFTALPIQIYNWTSQPQETFRDIAAAAIIVLLTLLLSLNAIAVLLRNRFRRTY